MQADDTLLWRARGGRILYAQDLFKDITDIFGLGDPKPLGLGLDTGRVESSSTIMLIGHLRLHGTQLMLHGVQL